MARPKDIGTIAETAVARYLAANGFPHAERRVLRGQYDQGDITGCPGLVFEVKGGAHAKNAGDGAIAGWLAETEAERVNANADIGVLVVQRGGYGPARAGMWWGIVPIRTVLYWHGFGGVPDWVDDLDAPVRLFFGDVVKALRRFGYGTALLDGDIANEASAL